MKIAPFFFSFLFFVDVCISFLKDETRSRRVQRLHPSVMSVVFVFWVCVFVYMSGGLWYLNLIVYMPVESTLLWFLYFCLQSSRVYSWVWPLFCLEFVLSVYISIFLFMYTSPESAPLCCLYFCLFAVLSSLQFCVTSVLFEVLRCLQYKVFTSLYGICM